ncbi:MAG: SHIRT domain-containing protein [Acutalibacteraceae bacterium]
MLHKRIWEGWYLSKATLNIGESISIDKNNDVYLPYGKIINVIKPLTYINSINIVHITSEDKVVESNEKAGTKLVKYFTDAGGESAATKAELDQVYIRSKYMPEDLVIGKSEHESQKDFMTYIAKGKYTVSYEFISGTKDKELPKEVMDLLPSDTKEYLQGTTVNAIQPDKTSVAVADGVWTFKGYELSEIEKITEDSEFIGIWEFTKNNDSNDNETNVDNGDTDNNKPNNDQKNDNDITTNINTGDSSNFIFLSIISFISVLGILLTVIIKYKKINH